MSTVIETRIRPGSAIALVNLAELRRYRDLLSMFVWRDFATKYKQTILGPIWFLVQPVLPALLFTVIFAQVAGMSTDGVPAFVFFLCNQVAWGYLATIFGAVSGALINNLGVFSKVYFPRLLVPISSLVSNLITLAIQILLLAAAFVYARYRVPGGETLHVTWASCSSHCSCSRWRDGPGFGLWMAAATAKYRDLQQVSAVLLQVWMYGSAVMFPLSRMHGKYRTAGIGEPGDFRHRGRPSLLIGVGTLSVARRALVRWVSRWSCSSSGFACSTEPPRPSWTWHEYARVAIIDVVSVSKRYRFGVIGATRLIDDAERAWLRLSGRAEKPDRSEFWALRDVVVRRCTRARSSASSAGTAPARARC